MKIKVQSRHVYGRLLHYPMCDLSRFLASLGRNPKIPNHTFTDDALKQLIAFGFVVEQIPQFAGA